ncbi:MAG: PSD1 and planctomycete cytochrome C domain-containing protein [Planctomycetaceae bacterium]
MLKSTLLLVVPLVLLCGIASSEDGEALFVRRISPLLHERCMACHGNEDDAIDGGLDLRTRDGVTTGGDSGLPAVAPGNPVNSPLYLAASRVHDDWAPMPPKEADRLSEQQLNWLKQWIEAGAPWPDTARQDEIARTNADKWSIEDGVPVETSGGQSQQWSERRYQRDALWAYQSVIKPVVAMDGGHPIDALLQLRMPAGLTAAPPADRPTLIRRATFDLTGLPPTPEEVTAFVRDPQDNDAAFATVVDRLLSSPHYGERMAQHWLDVVRYADSSGFANDYERGNAWRYRDYVIRAFNQDKPFDQFAREQIAGDEIEPDNPEMAVAVGFLRMGPWELTGMEVAKIARQRFLDDVTNSVGETFLAHSLQCARCHDHKFDPIPTRDYYAVQAVFATTQLAERNADFLPEENRSGFSEAKYLEKRRQEYQQTLKRLDDKMLAAARGWFDERGLDASAWHAAVAKIRDPDAVGPLKGKSKRRDGDGVFNPARALMRNQGVAEDQYPPKLLGFSPEDFGNERVARKGLERLKWELERYQPFALSVYSGLTPDVKSVNAPVRVPPRPQATGELERTCILVGGDPFSPGDPVEPGVLSCLQGAVKPIDSAVDGRRQAFAEWVANPSNSLTTRTIANRIWQWHFGQAIAGNPNNFGSTGKRPTHPELLDWLAATFVEDGWSFKSLHRRIMTSAAYQRSASHPDRQTLTALDPEQVSYAVFRPRRLSAQELRDSMLFATGELNRAVGGIPNRPEINFEAALQPRQVMGTFAAAWVPNPLPQDRHRRSIYALKTRGLRDPFMEVFDDPSPDFSCERREASTVTPQVFSLFNGQSVHQRALALAHRAWSQNATFEDAAAYCFERTLQRRPTTDELETCEVHYENSRRMHASLIPVAAQVPLKVRRDAVEENTGEKFSFDEVLHANADFVPDLQPDDVDLRCRALAELCLVLFNSNEFLYVY